MLIAAIIYAVIGLLLGIMAFLGGKNDGESTIRVFFIALPLAFFWPILIGITIIGLVHWAIVGD